MDALQIDKALTDLMLEKMKERQTKLTFLPQDAKNERKAVQIEIGMYNLFVGFGQMYHVKYSCTYEQRRNHVLQIREKMTLRENLFSVFPKIKNAYEAASEADKKCVVAALQGEIHMRNSFYNKYLKDLELAKQFNDVDKIFEMGIKVSVLEEGFRIWEKYRQDNDVYPGMFEGLAE